MRSSAPELLKDVLGKLAYKENDEQSSKEEGIIEESLPVCECYNKETKTRSQLLFEPTSKKYNYVGECSNNKICTMIMKQKHEFKIKNGNLKYRKNITYTANLNQYMQ